MRIRLVSLLLILLTCAVIVSAQAAVAGQNTAAPVANIPAPQDVLGFTPGDDRKLASWNQVITYFEKLDQSSDRVVFQKLGKTTMGAPFVMATISAPENLAHLSDFIDIQRSLADPRQLGSQNAVRERKARALIARGKTVVAITCGIHSTEVGSYLSSMLIAHRLASSNEPEINEILRNTIILLVPSLNPDGVDIVKKWYDKTLGKSYEGAGPPVLYHKYVGHDNNRDWYAFTQVESQITVDKIYNVWRPQIVHDIHQQGEFGARLFLPPYMAPVEPNVPRQIVEGYSELGSWMAGEMRRSGFQGITTNSTYDAWTPARAYSHYHGGVRILSETASARIASPLNVKFEQLRTREGYDPQKASDRFGPVWRGGEWKLRNITDYMTAAAFNLLKHASRNRERWLTRFYEIGKEAVRPRPKGALYGFRIKVGPNTKPLLDILKRGQVEVEWLRDDKPMVTGYPGSYAVVPLAQPYGAFAKTLLEAQRYPDLRDASGHPTQPYDVTAHTLPLLMNVSVTPITAPFKGKLQLHARYNVAPPPCERMGNWRIALYRSSVPSMDEGWTRFVLDKCTDYESIGDKEIREKSFYVKRGPRLKDENVRYATIIIPDQPSRSILNGYRAGTMPAEYTGGLGNEGVQALREFVEDGGTLVCLNRASEFAIEQFKLPVTNVVAGMSQKEFFIPGSILRIELDESHGITEGMPKESIAWVENSPIFEITDAPRVSEWGDTAKVRVIARYPPVGNPLLSGWLLGADRIKGKAALVEVTMGKGRIILFGFRPQYRGQSLATYPLFFNAIRP